MIPPLRALAACAGAALLALGAGCGSDGGVGPQPQPGEPGLTVVSGGAADSIGAVVGPLIVELRDERGHVIAGEEIFFGAGIAGDPPRQTLDLLVPPPLYAASGWRTVTDSAGRAEARVRLGTVPGPASVNVRVPRLGMHETVLYTVRAGSPSRVRLAPRDTVVYAGTVARLRGTVTDRAGNPVAGTATYSVLEGPGTPGGETGVIQTTGSGTLRVIARVGPGADTVPVRAVPEGALAVIGRNGETVVVNLDGSRLTLVGGGSGPAWSPDGSRLVFSAGRIVSQPIGGEARLFLDPDTTPGHHHRPRYSRDGNWLYFFTAVPGEPMEMWRAPADGSGRERISPHPATEFEGGPSPSPDGGRIVYFAGAGRVTVRVRDLASGAGSGDLAVGHVPAWSPTEDLIAYIGLEDALYNGPVMLMRPDGSGVRRLSPPGVLYNLDVDFSPDGRWVVATRSGAAHLIEVDSGMVIELPFLQDALAASWRPTGPLP